MPPSNDFEREILSHDPLHGYIPYVAAAGAAEDEITEQHLIDHPWLQRMRQIHQLQTAWYVYPTAAHSRFEHILGVMHLGSRMLDQVYPTLAEVCPDLPSRPYIELLVRMAGLLHDVGHGPFGHFFDEHYLHDFGLTHETLGAEIIRRELAPLLGRMRRTPHGELAAAEELDAEQLAWLIVRPSSQPTTDQEVPRWLILLRMLFCGVYTIDNLDFVLRDGYMSGYAAQAFDLDRLLHYTFYTSAGLTIHERGLPALVRFVSVRGELFRSIYFHHRVRAIDLELAELFAISKQYFLPGDPRDHLQDYLHFTEWSLLVDVARWTRSRQPKLQKLGQRWGELMGRRISWHMACERTVFFRAGEPEGSSIFADAKFVEQQLRPHLPAALRELPFKVDLARHLHRPGTRGPAERQNFVYTPASGLVQPLDQHELYRQLPISYRICRVYARTNAFDAELGAALDRLIAPGGTDDRTNM